MDYDIPASKSFSLGIWKRLLPYLKPVGGRLAAALLLSLLSAGIDAVYPLFIMLAVDRFIVPGATEGLWVFALAYFGIIVLQGLTTVFSTRHSMVADVESSRLLRRDCFIHLQRLSLTYYNQTPVGYILARVISDTETIGSMIGWGVIFFFWDLFYVLAILVSMLILNVRLALIIILIVPAIIAISYLFKNWLLRANRVIRSINAKVTGVYNEGITGAKTTKTLVIEDKIIDEFTRVTGEMYGAQMRAVRLNAIFIPLVIFVGSMATAMVLYSGGYMVAEGVLAFGTLSVFISYALVILEPVQQIAQSFSEIIATQTNVERVTDLLDREYGIVDERETEEKYGDIFTPKPENWEPIRGDITFKDIWFKYPDGDEYVLEGFNLHIPAGTTVAIVGRTGAGKSTLVNLACRFLEPTRGQVLIDGRDYRERSLLWLQSRLGYVLQNPHLFSGTVMENIRYGRLDATDEEVIAAAKLACADTVVEKLERGYHTEVGEGGDRLSTGEKQLISFARAILADPPIFVLDEATSSIDTETEGLIQNAISHILKGRTSFIIAHRLSTIRHADLILVVDEGKIVERGSHDELMAQRGKYHGLYTTMMLRDTAEPGDFTPPEAEI